MELKKMNGLSVPFPQTFWKYSTPSYENMGKILAQRRHFDSRGEALADREGRGSA